MRRRSSVGHEAAVHGQALLLVAEVRGGRAAADRDQQQLGLDGLAAGDGDPDAGVGALDLLERLADLERRCRACGTPAPAALEHSSSSAATRRGSASTMVTSTPKDLQTLANSTPITPPPSTIAEAGTRSSVSACSVVMTRSPSISRPGRAARVGAGGQHDVAARCSAAPSTSTVVGPTRRPVPAT